MSNEGFTPTDEKAPQASNEAFVPANKLDEFNQLVEKTEALEDSADGYYAERDANEKSMKTTGRLAVAAGAAGLGFASIGIFPLAAVGAVGAYAGYKVVKELEDEAKSNNTLGQEADAQAVEFTKDSRKIVTDELLATGAVKDTKTKEQYAARIPNQKRTITLTPEQIEIARQEMESQMGE